MNFVLKPSVSVLALYRFLHYIYTNVLLKKDGTVWWEGADGPIPEEGTDWMGNYWKPGMTDENGKPKKGANPNSRFTSPIKQ